MGKNEYNNDIVCLLEYFYICGIREPRTNKINSLKCLSPEVLYSTCANENKEMIDYEVDNMDPRDILGVCEVLENKYSYNGDTYTICKI